MQKNNYDDFIFNTEYRYDITAELTIPLIAATAPQAKIFSYNETVLQWKTSFLSKKSLKISPTDTRCWGGTGLRPEIWGGTSWEGNGPSARNRRGEI